MPRKIDIEGAFHTAIKHAPDGLRTVTTEDFVKHLALAKWDWSLKEANDWIESHVSTFKDISPNEGQARTFMLFNPNGGL